jgi:predicted nucleic acid-binding protein
VTGLTDPAAGNDVHLAHLTAVEVVSGVARRRRGGSLSTAEAALILDAFRQDLTGQYLLMGITPARIDHAMGLAEHHGLRAYDAVQLAAALEVNAGALALGLALTVVSADAELNAAAAAEGLAVEDPNQH